jgi:hypothetical protein
VKKRQGRRSRFNRADVAKIAGWWLEILAAMKPSQRCRLLNMSTRELRRQVILWKAEGERWRAA